MAATLVPSVALDYVKIMVKNAPVTIATIKPAILYDASNMIWNAAPWRWSTGTVTAAVTASTQDTTVTWGSTYNRILRAFVKNVTTERELLPVAQQPANTLVGMPNFINYQSDTTARSDVTYPAFVAGETWTLIIYYKMNAPTLYQATPNGYDTAGALRMDDEWFWVYREACLYYGYKYADDPRAGGATTAMDPQGRKTVQYNGQLGVVMAAIETMKLAEPLMVLPYDQPVPERRNG